jgi:hypothetical protein
MKQKLKTLKTIIIIYKLFFFNINTFIKKIYIFDYGRLDY